MKTLRLALCFLLPLIVASCIPDGARDKMNAQILSMQKMLADQEFKKAVAYIELHKVRYGAYPGSLKELTYLSSMDSMISTNVYYERLDSCYELNIKMEGVTFGGDKQNLDLKYPPEFWEGLGCVKSNTKE